MFYDPFSFLSIIWTSFHSCLSPTILFLLLNLMIATILVTSGFPSSLKPHHLHNHHQPSMPFNNLPRSPQFQNSLPVSDPFREEFSKGIEYKVTQTQTQTPAIIGDTFHNTRPTQSHTRAHAPTIEEDVFHCDRPTQIKTRTLTLTRQEDLEHIEGSTLDEIYNKIKGTSSVHYNRQNSDSKTTGGQIPVRLPAMMKKSASDKSAFNHFQAVHDSKNLDSADVVEAAMATVEAGGSEVDARADDFISRFKKQLQLQRIESIRRYTTIRK